MVDALIHSETNSPYNEVNINFYVQAVITKLPQSLSLKNFSELVIVFVNEKRIRTLNLDFRKIDKVTDVLSFTSDDPESMGELVFCLAKMQEQAKENRHSLSLEFLYLLLHGILHLLGYDHEKQEDAKEMFAIQDAIFADLSASELATLDCFQI